MYDDLFVLYLSIEAVTFNKIHILHNMHKPKCTTRVGTTRMAESECGFREHIASYTFEHSTALSLGVIRGVTRGR